MKTLPVVLAALAGLVVVGGGALIYIRGQRAIATVDPAHAELVGLLTTLTAGVKSLAVLPGKAAAAATAATAPGTGTVPADEATATKAPDQGVSRDSYDAPIKGRDLGKFATYADYATAGIYPK